jgi:hypothetical protein
MADELIKAGAGLPATPQMNVTASQSATAIGQVMGDVRLEMGPEAITLLQQIIGSQQIVSHAAEWALLNQERFNVFVLENERYDCGSFCIGRRVALSKNTLPDYRDYYRPLTQPLIQELLNMPCIFAVRNQSFKKAPDHYPAFVGRLTDITCQSENIRFRFVTCGKLRQQFINDNIRSFNLLTTTVRNQLDEEHWSIRTGNLLQIADAVGIEIK